MSEDPANKSRFAGRNVRNTNVHKRSGGMSTTAELIVCMA